MFGSLPHHGFEPIGDDCTVLSMGDEALVMTVHPGYGGQKFIEDCMPKVETLRRMRPNLDIMVDGGINAETALIAAKAGANQFVAGSYLFKQADMKAAVDAMRTGVSR